MSKNAPAIRVHCFEPNGDALNGIDFPPGSTQRRETDRIMYVCPGCERWGGLRCGHPKPAQTPSWDIVSGDLDSPESLTLQPSILCSCGWHGYLTNGVYTSC